MHLPLQWSLKIQLQVVVSKRKSFSAMIHLKANRKARSFSVQYTWYSDLKRVVARNELETQKVCRSLSDTGINKWENLAPFRRHSIFPDIKYNIDTQPGRRNFRSASVESTHKMAFLPRRAPTTKGRVYNPPDGLSFKSSVRKVGLLQAGTKKWRSDEVWSQDKGYIFTVRIFFTGNAPGNFLGTNGHRWRISGTWF